VPQLGRPHQRRRVPGPDPDLILTLTLVPILVSTLTVTLSLSRSLTLVLTLTLLTRPSPAPRNIAFPLTVCFRSMPRSVPVNAPDRLGLNLFKFDTVICRRWSLDSWPRLHTCSMPSLPYRQRELVSETADGCMRCAGAERRSAVPDKGRADPRRALQGQRRLREARLRPACTLRQA